MIFFNSSYYLGDCINIFFKIFHGLFFSSSFKKQGFFFLFQLINLFIYFIAWSLPLPPKHHLTQSLTYLHSPSLKKWSVPQTQIYPSTLAHHISAVRCILSYKSRKGSLVRGMDRQQLYGQSPLQLLGDAHGDWAPHLLHMCQGPWSSPCRLVCWWLSLWEPIWVQVSWLSWSCCRVPIQALKSLNLYPNLSMWVPQLHPMCWLWVSISVLVSYWMEPLREQLC